MKWLIASDIHGSAYFCRRLMECCEKEGAERILLLGDLLYHGPRNDLPRDYAPKEVIALLNARDKDILCVRGNCEAEVDQMVLSFPVMADTALLAVGGRILFATHGHIYNEEKRPPLHPGDILLQGHTHVPLCRVQKDFVCMNPGSVSLPKNDSWHGYMTLDTEQGIFLWKDLDGNRKKEYSLS